MSFVIIILVKNRRIKSNVWLDWFRYLARIENLTDKTLGKDGRVGKNITRRNTHRSRFAEVKCSRYRGFDRNQK